MRQLIRPLAVLALLLGISLSGAPARAAAPLTIAGRAFDTTLNTPLAGVCVTVGVPGAFCWSTTAADGSFFINMDTYQASPGGQWDLYFIKTGFSTAYFGKFVLNGPYNTPPIIMQRGGPAATGNCTASGTPTQTTYLPNITRTLGGPLGWDTPFFVQNAGSSPTAVEASFYYFDTGALATCHRTASLAAGASIVEDPNLASDLADDRQYSVVVRSYGSNVVAAVNQTQTVGGKIQALSYSGFATGATKVYVPNVTRKFFGYDVPLIIQNLGTAQAVVSASFVSFDGTSTLTVSRLIDPGKSKVIDPDSDDAVQGAPGLRDQTQYAVTVSSSQPVGVVANAHDEAIGPVAYSHNGLATGATTVYGPWATKGASLFSNVVVQNLGTAAATATLTFKPTTGGAAQVFTTASIPAGAASAFDVRYANGIAIQSAQLCGSAASATCLGFGDYGLTVTSTQPVAAVVLPNSDTLAGAYVALANPTNKTLAPVAQRAVGGWTSSIWLQTTTGSTATLTFTPIGGGASVPVTTSLTAGLTKKIDLATTAGLANGQQYAVVITADGPIAAVVQELNLQPGDGLMVYEGFAQ